MLVALANHITMWLGRTVAYVSSFAEYVRAEMFYVPLFQLLKPLYDLCVCWLWFFTEYAKTAATFSNQYVVYWGSFFILMLIVDGGLYAFYPRDWETYWEIVVGGFVLTGCGYVVFFFAYKIGIALHELIKSWWNGANKNDALVAEKNRRAKPQDTDKSSAEKNDEYVATPDALPTTDKKVKKNKN